jgi:hypothetical protein
MTNKTRSVGEILEVAGVTDEYFRIDVKQLKIENNPIEGINYRNGMRAVLNQKLKPEDVCVVDKKKAHKVINANNLNKYFWIDRLDLDVMANRLVDDLISSNAVKFKEV